MLVASVQVLKLQGGIQLALQDLALVNLCTKVSAQVNEATCKLVHPGASGTDKSLKAGALS